MSSSAAHEERPVEVSVVMPCLNEADTLATCIAKAKRAIEESGVEGEVVVADNGSTDGSIEIAREAGAVVAPVARKGYGSALMGGIAAARGKYIVMGDADDSYDFLQIPRFLEKLREGAELVQGCRLAAGGGSVEPGAMPFLHRWLGNPAFSWVARRWFGVPIHDVHCGMRAFTKEAYERLQLRCTGMEFATEMIIKARLFGVRIAEVPITLHPDGRTSHGPHLKTFRDGWRHMRFYLISSPEHLFLYPGIVLMLLGLIGYGIAMPGLTIRGINFDVHTLLFASLGIICGHQAVLFWLLMRTYAVNEGLLPDVPRYHRWVRRVNLERGLLVAAAALAAGAVLLLLAVNQWRLVHFGSLNYARTMRLVIPGATLTMLGVQTLFFSFSMSILGLRRASVA
jgi:glycosyltransferase involved in cell wall biosynthesis